MPIYLSNNKTNALETADCFNDEVVIKYKIENLKAKDIPFIVDQKVREKVRQRLNEHNNKEKDAFKTTLWFNEDKQIPIRTVRCFTGLSAVETVKKDNDGKQIGFAVLGNNHHIAIYKEREGKLSQHSCTFWHAVERKRFNLPVIIQNTQLPWNSILDKELPQSFLDKLPPDNLILEYSLQQNEMFILGLSKDESEQAINEKNNSLISKHLYLVWSIGENDYWFRHHLETKNTELKNIPNAKEMKRYFRFKSVGAFISQNPIKVRINNIGIITKVGEY